MKLAVVIGMLSVEGSMSMLPRDVSRAAVGFGMGRSLYLIERDFAVPVDGRLGAGLEEHIALVEVKDDRRLQRVEQHVRQLRRLEPGGVGVLAGLDARGARGHRRQDG